MRSAACPPPAAAAWACDQSAAACARRARPPAAWPSCARGRQRPIVGGAKSGRQMLLHQIAEGRELRVLRHGFPHVLKSTRQIGQVAALAVAPEQPCENTQHLDVALQTDEVEPAQELWQGIA